MSSKKAQTLKVGAFVLFGMALTTAAIFIIGENRRVWDRKTLYHAAYDDVVGLRSGAVVRMGGIDIGSVSKVEHSKKAEDSKVYVTLEVASEEAVRVRKGMLATVENKGLLGDKMVEIKASKELADDLLKAGQDPNATIAPDGWITTAPPPDMMGDAQKAAQGAKIAMEQLKKATEGIADEQFKNDLHGTVKSLREILDAISQKDGVAHRLIFDPEEARKVDRILGNLEATTANLARVSSDASSITNQVKTGPGLVHTLVYDDEMAKGMAGTLVELHRTLTAVRTSNGLAHSVVYGDDQTQRLMGNVNAMSDDLREIIANVKAGRGTVGALLVDPTVYEDIKSLVGNVERNQVLRALVRYSIKQNETSPSPHAEVKADVPQPVATPAAQK